MTADLHFDVLIVGAGLVGGAMACALAEHPACEALSIGLIEASEPAASPSGTEFDPRVVALTHASQELLEDIGIWHDVLRQRACAYERMHVWDAEGTGDIQFDASEVQRECLGHIVENSVITSLLWRKMQDHPGIELLHPAQLSQLSHNPRDGASLIELADGRSVAAKLLIAADGAHSKVRGILNMETREWDYGHSAIVSTVTTSEPHQFTAWQRFLEIGPLAFLPLQVGSQADFDEYHSSIVWSAKTEVAQELMALSDEAFCQRLGDAFEGRLGDVTAVAKRFSFPLRQRHAKEYILPGVALIGDAAHTIHPLAGQGVNLGFLDVIALSEEIIRACRRDLPLNEPSILKRYQRNRKWHNLGMMAVMEGFKTLFGSDDLPLRWLRNEGMRRVNNLGALKNLIVKQAMGL
ncbi:UbiH/UbiF/VisC/COQ6 family ubiquinone biosynthesis hydroxylase [Candidatus Pelagadaptatus aseana]|uniref:UbiH/UbiF/VisC/COQ6 family ubiquinone biosynthesis hydroxylase n=1 Tax=Candidatus Pelagadaptatus aseana TaxID=3120508 RepID=UPI003C6FFB68